MIVRRIQKDLYGAAVYLLLELNATIWAKLAEKVRENSNGKYAVTGQCFVKMFGLKRTFKNISDQNKKSGNCWNTWAFYSVIDSIFGKKAFVVPPAIASSEGLVKPTNVAESADYTLRPTLLQFVDPFRII
ncbi:hypothetical protein P5V15_011281 [Pogonomyrmex californicus]